MRKFLMLTLSVGAALLMQVAQAAPISGTFNIAGLDDASIQPTALDFLCASTAIGNLLAPCSAAPAGAGNFIISTGAGDFDGYSGQGGYILDLGLGTAPLNTPFDLANFITFATTPANPVLSPDIALDLTFIFLGSSGQAACAAAPVPGQICTPTIPALVSASNPGGLSPYNLQNLSGGGSTASFAVAGNFRRISTGELTPFQGTFTSHFNEPYQQVLADLNSNGHIDNSYSATFAGTAASIPEPGTLSLLVGGVLLLTAGSIRKLRRG